MYVYIYQLIKSHSISNRHIQIFVSSIIIQQKEIQTPYRNGRFEVGNKQFNTQTQSEDVA